MKYNKYSNNKYQQQDHKKYQNQKYNIKYKK